MPAKPLPQRVYDKTKLLLEQDSSSVIKAVLEGAFWPRLIETRVGYRRVSDDTSGDITVSFSHDGDGWIEVLSRLDPRELAINHRFRSYFGGGESERVRNALLVLAIAIKLDNESRPQDHRRHIEDPP